jgi:hypothetical protein
MFNIGPTLGPVSLMRLRPKLLFMAIFGRIDPLTFRDGAAP